MVVSWSIGMQLTEPQTSLPHHQYQEEKRLAHLLKLSGPLFFTVSTPLYRIQCPLLSRTKKSINVSRALQSCCSGTAVFQLNSWKSTSPFHAHTCIHCPICHQRFQITVKQHMESIEDLQWLQSCQKSNMSLSGRGNPCGHMVVVKGAALATLAGLSRTEMLLLCLDLYLQ